MGNDGGTIPSRSEILNFNGGKIDDPKARNASVKQLARWKTIGRLTHCHLTGQKLVSPIVSDCMGNLYNKEAILEALLDKKPPEHVRSLKDVVDLKIELDVDQGVIVCPVSGKYDLQNCSSDRLRFCYLVPCGCVMNRSALDELLKGSKCPVCGTTVNISDVIDINPDEYICEKLGNRLKEIEDAGLTHSLKRKKRKKSHVKSSKRQKT